MLKVKQLPHPLPPRILGVSVCLLILSGKDRGDNSIKSYRNDPTFSDRYAWANSADPDQTAPLGAV